MTIIADQLSPGVCRGCRQRIIWAYLSPTMKAHPLDPPFSIHNRREVEERGRPGHFIAIGEVDASASHFHTCPQAGRFRKQKAEGSRQSQLQRRKQPRSDQAGAQQELFE